MRLTILVYVFTVVGALHVSAAVRTSANYSITAESTDGGGHAAGSANYASVASVEAAAMGISSGFNYATRHGFMSSEESAPTNLPPVAAEEAYSTDEDIDLSGTLTGIDPENDPLTFAKGTDPAHGSVNVNPDGSFTYTPNANYNGPDSFTFKANDGTADGEPAMISITVNPVNDAPFFAVGSAVAVDEDSGSYSARQATDIGDGDPEVEQTLAFNVTNNKNSLFSVQPAIAPDGTLTFTPAPDAVGGTLVTVTLTDDNTAGGEALTTSDQTFTITLRDKTPPIITLLGEASVTHEAGEAYIDAGAVATDNFDGDLTPQIVTVIPVDASTPGVYAVTYDLTDAAGNAATQVSRIVTVVDTTAPEFATFPPDVILYCDGDTTPSATGDPTTADNVSGKVTLTHADTVEGTCPTLITRTWTATDASGNAASEAQEIHLVPYHLLTDAAHRLFDMDPSTQEREFRLIYTLDPSSPSTFKLSTSNPGQFAYHVLYLGTPGEAIEIVARIPFPFVTGGELAVHDGVAVTFDSVGVPYLVPGPIVSSASTLVTLEDFGEASHFQLAVSLTVPESGVADLAFSVDYGLKRTAAYDRNYAGDAIDPATGQTLIANLAEYRFETSMPYGESSDTVRSFNEFKANPGVAGLVQWMPGEVAVPGLTVSLLDDTGRIVKQALTDEDGFYQIVYKHKGKPADYSVVLEGDLAPAQTVTLKGSAFYEVNFVIIAE